ncbi:MAG: BatD family protein [bacterium]
MNIILYILLLTLTFFNSNIWAQDISFEASVDRHVLGINDQLTLSVSISGGNLGGIPSPQLPPLKGFDIVNSYRSQSISIVNAQVSTSLEIKYVLVPKDTGKFTIPPIILNYRDKLYQTTPIDIEVTGERKVTPVPSQPTPSQPVIEPSRARGNLFLDAWVNKHTVFVNEQITLKIKFYQKISLWENPGYNPPSFTGFWVEDLPVCQQPTRQIIDGREYLVHEVMNKALFPTSQGEFTIGEAIMSCVVSPFQGAITLKTAPIKIKVLPLPPNKPKNFSGAIGNFSISCQVDKNTVEENQPVSLKIKIKGTGNIKTIPKPNLPKLIDFKKYDSGESSQVYNSNLNIEGEKEYKYVLVPTSPGKHVIDPITLSYFNPATQRYEISKTPKITITAKPQMGTKLAFNEKRHLRQEVQVLKEDIRYIKEPLNLTTRANLLYQNKLFLLLQILPILSIAAAFSYKRHLIRLNQDIKYSRLKRANKKAAKGLSKAKSLLSEDTIDEFYGIISKTLIEYLGDKLNLLPNEVTSETLNAKELKEDIINEVQDILQTCDYARFAPSTYTLENMKEILNKTKNLIGRI